MGIIVFHIPITVWALGALIVYSLRKIYVETPIYFVALMRARLLKEADKLDPFWEKSLSKKTVWLKGYILDILYNQAYGSLYFRERPRKLTFTSRVKYHLKYNSPGTPKYDLAVEWARKLNNIDPNHIKLSGITPWYLKDD